MAGNVWEWTADWYGSKYYSTSPASNPTGPATATYRVNRGGGLGSSAGDLRASFRYADVPENSWGILGFRCCTSLD